MNAAGFKRFMALVCLCVACGVHAETPRGGSMPVNAIGLSPGSLDDVPTPPRVVSNDSEPGDRPLLPRVFAGAPPLMPHGAADYLPIEREDNACVFCHQVEEKVEGDATPIPQSHYRDLRNAPAVVRKEVAGARWNCIACHPPLSDAVPLVGNSFGN